MTSTRPISEAERRRIRDVWDQAKSGNAKLITPAEHPPMLDLQEVRRAIGLIMAPDQVFEMRAMQAITRGWSRPREYHGYFDNVDAFCLAIQEITFACGIYITLNPVNPALLARAANRIKPSERGQGVSDKDILRRRWLPIDADPKRPSGISSTDAEHEAALAVVKNARDWLRQQGWPEPILADSGNGAHLLYRIDQPADDGGLVARVVQSLCEQFNTESVEIDHKVCNPSRIWKLYGSRACKGDPTADRPHRMARILEVPHVG